MMILTRSSELTRALGSAMLAAALLGAPLRATEGRILPAFEVVAIDGTPAASAALASSGTALLLVVEPSCMPCDSLLRAAASGESGALERVAIVVEGADAAVARAEAARYPALAAARWYGDPGRAAGAGLNLTGRASIVGLRGRVIEWTLGGALADSKDLRAILGNWLAR
jgi:hypothetical protein